MPDFYATAPYRSPPRPCQAATSACLAVLLLLASAPGFAGEPLRDPTRPYTPAERARESTPRFVVNAIIVSPERRVAIVNGRRLTVGASLDGATVIAIEKDQLVLEIDGRRISAGLNEGAMRR